MRGTSGSSSEAEDWSNRFSSGTTRNVKKYPLPGAEQQLSVDTRRITQPLLKNFLLSETPRLILGISEMQFLF